MKNIGHCIHSYLTLASDVAKILLKKPRPFLRIELAQFRVGRRVARLREKQRIRVAFLVVFDTVFHFEKLFRLMKDDARFEPFILVIPQVDRGKAWGDRQYERVLTALRVRYGDYVRGAYRDGKYEDVDRECDICVVMNSYDALTLPQYGIEYLGSRGVPVIDTNYGCDAGMHYTNFFCGMGCLAYLWRFYCGTEFFTRILSQRQINLRLHGNIRHSGVVKMDLLADVAERPRERKCILVCPHHSIEGNGGGLSLSNFLQYSELIQKLPQRYAKIDWIFRPHPLLKAAMLNSGGWSEGDWDHYIARLCSNENVKYIPDGDCYDMFVNSDGMIQDCSSFLGEYHYTGHPQCYLLKSDEHMRSQYMEWGVEMLSHTYKAFSEADIFNFIEKVVIGGVDEKKSARERFVNERLRYNYPHVSEWVLTDIKQAIWRHA